MTAAPGRKHMSPAEAGSSVMSPATRRTNAPRDGRPGQQKQGCQHPGSELRLRIECDRSRRISKTREVAGKPYVTAESLDRVLGEIGALSEEEQRLDELEASGQGQQWEASQIRRDLHARRAAANPGAVPRGRHLRPPPTQAGASHPRDARRRARQEAVTRPGSNLRKGGSLMQRSLLDPIGGRKPARESISLVEAVEAAYHVASMPGNEAPKALLSG